MRVIFTILSFVCMFTFSGCASSPRIEHPVRLTPKQFADHSLSLLSDTQVEQYDFWENGMALACLGTKEAITGPALYWEIVNGDTLRMTNRAQISISYQFRSLTRHNAVTMDGKKFRRD